MKSKKSTKVRVTRTGRRLALALAFSLGLGYFMTSCNVTRRITSESSFLQRGDSTCNIVTKTTETYDASKKF